MNIGDYAIVTELLHIDECAGVRVGDIVTIKGKADSGSYYCAFSHELKQVMGYLRPNGTFAMSVSQLMKIEFIPGDIVRHSVYGIGTVKGIRIGKKILKDYAVEFEKSKIDFHTCDGRCNDKKGYYCIEEWLELVKRGDGKMEKRTTDNEKKRMRQSDIIFEKMSEVAGSTGINIEKIEEIQPDKIYILHQKNGSKIKTVCDHGDVFSRETAAMIMVAKANLGGSKFNNRVKKLLQYWELQDKYNAELEKEEISRQKKQRKWDEHKKAAEKRAKEARIEEQKEAYVRAIKELGVNTSTLVPVDKEFLSNENRG